MVGPLIDQLIVVLDSSAYGLAELLLGQGQYLLPADSLALAEQQLASWSDHGPIVVVNQPREIHFILQGFLAP